MGALFATFSTIVLMLLSLSTRQQWCSCLPIVHRFPRTCKSSRMRLQFMVYRRLPHARAHRLLWIYIYIDLYNDSEHFCCPYEQLFSYLTYVAYLKCKID